MHRLVDIVSNWRGVKTNCRGRRGLKGISYFTLMVQVIICIHQSNNDICMTMHDLFEPILEVYTNDTIYRCYVHELTFGVGLKKKYIHQSSFCNDTLKVIFFRKHSDTGLLSTEF